MRGFKVLLIVLLAVFLSFSAKVYAADEIGIGVVGPMKFVFGEDGWKGAQMAAEKINAEGGIKVKGKSYQIVLHKADSNDFLSVPDAVSAMEKLATVQKVKYVVGGFRSEAVLAQQEVMADHKMIFLGNGSASDEQCLRVARNYERYKYWFRVQPVSSNDQKIQYAAISMPVIRALNKMGIKKPRVALLIDKAQYAESIAEGASKLFSQMGCEVVGMWRPSFTATSYNSELSAIKSAGAHLIFTCIAGPAGNVISRQWGELQIPAAMMGVNIEGSRVSHWKTTDGKCNYMATALGMGDVDMSPKTRAFFAESMKRFGSSEPLIYNGFGNYDSIFILKEAMERAQSLDPDAIVPELEKTNHVGVVGRIVFTPRNSKQPHDLIWGPNAYTPVVIQWREGKQAVVWPDGQELHPAAIDAGAPKGWDKLKFKGTVDYVLPPWVVEYWKDKK